MNIMGSRSNAFLCHSRDPTDGKYSECKIREGYNIAAISSNG